ncbi:MAG: hypothetical protein QXE33_02510 [Candidatus Micrarchaeaceae archaeon]
MHMVVYAARSTDGRYRTGLYKRYGGECFAVSEKIGDGILVSEFSKNGVLMDQIYTKGNEPFSVLSEYIAVAGERLELDNSGRYEQVVLDAECPLCKSRSLVREYDSVGLDEIKSAKVVPIFVCRNCKGRFYSISEHYIEKLVSEHIELFDEGELNDYYSNREAFIGELKEYIIRIFASKKIINIKLDQ